MWHTCRDWDADQHERGTREPYVAARFQLRAQGAGSECELLYLTGLGAKDAAKAGERPAKSTSVPEVSPSKMLEGSCACDR